MAGEALLRVEKLNASYGLAQILFDLDLEVAPGEVLALLGRNGAGKSTTLKSIIGLLPPRSGAIQFAGERIDGRPAHVIARLGVGYVPEDRRIFSELSVEENLGVGRQSPREGASCWTPERLYRLFPNLGEMRRRMAGKMSGGEQQMLTIARTLMGNPKLLLLDEPSEGLAPKIVEDMAETIRSLKREGLAVLLSEQNLRFAAHIADRAAIIEKGRIRYVGAMRELLADAAAQHAFLSA